MALLKENKNMPKQLLGHLPLDTDTPPPPLAEQLTKGPTFRGLNQVAAGIE
jgi:hypothetical protein